MAAGTENQMKGLFVKRLIWFRFEEDAALRVV